MFIGDCETWLSFVLKKPEIGMLGFAYALEKQA